MSTEVQLKVDPEVIREQEDIISTEIDNVARQFEYLTNTIEGTSSYWEGMASDKHRSSFENIKQDMETVLKRLKEHPDELLQMAGLYDEAEETATQLALELPDDVIE